MFWVMKNKLDPRIGMLNRKGVTFYYFFCGQYLFESDELFLVEETLARWDDKRSSLEKEGCATNLLAGLIS